MRLTAQMSKSPMTIIMLMAERPTQVSMRKIVNRMKPVLPLVPLTRISSPLALDDYRMVTVTGDVWLGVYVSDDSGTTWFNTFVPGFTTDTSAAGLDSPLLGLDASGDPVVRFDAEGNLYVAAIAFNRNFDKTERPLDNLVYVARYDYTPGTPAGTSTPNSAANPPNFTYAFTTVVDRGSVGFAVPGVVGFAGTFTDKEWMEIDNYPDSPCSGYIYVAHTNFHASG